jgi:hypothetical protein
VVATVARLDVFAFAARPGTVGAAAVPARSPASCTTPLVVVVASAAAAVPLAVQLPAT